MAQPYSVVGVFRVGSEPDEQPVKGVEAAILALVVEECHVPEGKLPKPGTPVQVTIRDLTPLDQPPPERVTGDERTGGRS